jgi:ketosteroid isomerase-like protein
MKNISTIVFVLLTFGVSAQTNNQQDIDQQVWKPFVKAIMERDVDTFISLHSKDLIRAERDGTRVLNYDQYKKSMEGWSARKETNKANNAKHIFELRFLERISNETQAFEVGYFKNETISATGEKRAGYGQFHVALRKENGLWKILVDSDSNNGRTITEEMFQAAKPIE